MSAADVALLLRDLRASVANARADRGEHADPHPARHPYQPVKTTRVTRPVPHQCPGHAHGCPVCERAGEDRKGGDW